MQVVIRETFLSSLDMARGVLEGLGLDDYEAEKAVRLFREIDEARLKSQPGENDEEQMISLAKQAARELEEMFAEDAKAEEQQ